MLTRGKILGAKILATEIQGSVFVNAGEIVSDEIFNMTLNTKKGCLVHDNDLIHLVQNPNTNGTVKYHIQRSKQIACDEKTGKSIWQSDSVPVVMEHERVYPTNLLRSTMDKNK